MAKKGAKKKPIDEIEEDISDLEDDKIEIVLPKIDKKIEIEKKDSKEVPLDSKIEIEKKDSEEIPIDSDELLEEDYEEELDEEEPEILDYKHVKLNIHDGLVTNDYVLDVIGQSHGFCNILVKYLLNTDGVKLAAYKITGIEPPQVFIRLEDGKKIKDILFKCIEVLHAEVVEVEKVFQKLM